MRGGAQGGVDGHRGDGGGAVRQQRRRRPLRGRRGRQDRRPRRQASAQRQARRHHQRDQRHWPRGRAARGTKGLAVARDGQAGATALVRPPRRLHPLPARLHVGARADAIRPDGARRHRQRHPAAHDEPKVLGGASSEAAEGGGRGGQAVRCTRHRLLRLHGRCPRERSSGHHRAVRGVAAQGGGRVRVHRHALHQPARAADVEPANAVVAVEPGTASRPSAPPASPSTRGTSRRRSSARGASGGCTARCSWSCRWPSRRRHPRPRGWPRSWWQTWTRR